MSPIGHDTNSAVPCIGDLTCGFFSLLSHIFGGEPMSRSALLCGNYDIYFGQFAA